MAIVADAGLRSHPILASGARGPARRVLGAARPLRACAGTRSIGWSGAGAHSPRGEARNRSRCGGRTGMGARSLTGGAAPVVLWWADRRRCTLPYGRRGDGRAVEGGPTQVHAPLREALAGTRSIGWSGAGAHSPRGEARNRSRCGGRTGMGARSFTGGAARVALWWADRRGCTLPYGRRGAGRAVVGGPAQVHAPLREALAGRALVGRPT